ncbi:RNA polymerase recycling motor ATPase HelR [Rathayibacter sp. CAU 1779]
MSAEAGGRAGARSAFDLPPRLAAKADPALIGGDEAQFAAIGTALRTRIDDLNRRLDEERAAPGGAGQQSMDRDLEVRRLASELRLMRRFGLDLCLGRMVTTDGEAVYIGRIGLTDDDGRRLLVDWRAPASEPFFAATHANPMGLVSRRRYRWSVGRVSDYWDEVFTAEGLEHNAALDDQSAFIASLGTSRSSRMRDVLSTIQADQDAIIRADSHGPLVVDGGPGTGKTVVALHRAAYLLYSEPRFARGGGGVLFVGPHQAYLSYVDDVLPSLGEESVQICTLRDMLPEGAEAREERDARVAALKASEGLERAVEAAVRAYETPPAAALTVETPWAEIEVGSAQWREAFGSAEPGSTHNDARDQVWESLLEILIDEADDEDAPPHLIRRYLAQDEALTHAFTRAWPVLDPAGVVSDLLTVPGYLAGCAPWLSDDDVRMLQREDGRAWTTSDLPLLDAARQRIGDPEAIRRSRQREAAVAAEQEQKNLVVADLIAADDSELMVMKMLRGEDLQNTLVDQDALPAIDPDLLAGPFAHVIVDEAQELTDAEWQMLLRRCPSRSFTIVGDRAQARHGFTQSWQERLARVGVGEVTMSSLSVNYRTPVEVMTEAEPVIRAAFPDANVPTSIRTSGIPVVHGSVTELEEILESWLESSADGVACVIGAPDFRGMPRVRSLSPVTVKGLEFDLVVIVDPDAFGDGIEGAVDRYVAMTRSTQQLAILATATG